MIEAEFLKKLLEEVNAEIDIKIVVCAGSTTGQTAQNLTRRGYKLCKEGESGERVLYLTLDQYTTDGSLYQKAKLELSSAVRRFWAPQNTALTEKVHIEY